MKKLLFILFLTACSQTPENKTLSNTESPQNISLSPKDYFETLEDRDFAADSKTTPFFVVSVDLEKGFLTYENKAVEGQMLGLLTTWNTKNGDLVLKIENSLIGGTRTDFLKLYHFKGKNYQNLDTEQLKKSLDKIVAQKSQTFRQEAQSDTFEAWWAINLPDNPQKPLVLEISMNVFWHKNNKREEKTLIIGSLLCENDQLVFKPI